MTATPIGIQRRRAKGFDLQAESKAINGLPAKCVTRGTQWGNPYKIGKEYNDPFKGGVFRVTRENCLELFEIYAKEMLATFPDWLEPLRGYNLACFCGSGSPCHRDVLLRLLEESESRL
jgi:Domain of unknown function (DUF4326)